jgi:hypothetical protein
MREIVNAILYQSRTGCQWDYLPYDLPPKERGLLYHYVARWRDDGTDQTIHDLLRWHARERQGQPEPWVFYAPFNTWPTRCSVPVSRRTPVRTVSRGISQSLPVADRRISKTGLEAPVRPAGCRSRLAQL